MSHFAEEYQCDLAAGRDPNKKASDSLSAAPCWAFPLVLVEWVDSHYRPGWTTEESQNEPLVCRSVGWLVYDGEETKVLSANISKEESPQRCGDITIPSRAILQIREITV